jgi:hypothetical protein
VALVVEELEVQAQHQTVKTDTQVEMEKQMILEVQHQAHLTLHSQVAEVVEEQMPMEHQVVQELEDLVAVVEVVQFNQAQVQQLEQPTQVVAVAQVEKMELERQVDQVKL